MTHEMTHLLFVIGLILICSKIFSGLAHKIKIAPVFMLILIGIVLGDAGLGLVDFSFTLEFLGEIGVIFLLFTAGLETDIKTVRRSGVAGLFVACGGVILPFCAGYFVARFYNINYFEACFLGAILTATSVSVTVMTLWEIKKLNTIIGTIILSAAVIDDILGIIILAILISLKTGHGGLVFSIFKMAMYITFASFFGYTFFPRIFHYVKKLRAPFATTGIAFGIVFLYCALARLGHVAPITGAYIAGLFMGLTNLRHSLLEKTSIIGNSLFIPIFFVSIGLRAKFLPGQSDIFFIVLFVLAGLLSKFVGAFLGALLSKESFNASLKLGCGMMPRGEVALVMAATGLNLNLVRTLDFNATVVLVVISAAVVPLFLKKLYQFS